jgi:hypothetical protein
MAFYHEPKESGQPLVVAETLASQYSIQLPLDGVRVGFRRRHLLRISLVFSGVQVSQTPLQPPMILFGRLNQRIVDAGQKEQEKK